MDEMPFTPFEWPAWVCYIAEGASGKHWAALAVSILLLIFSR